MYLFLVETPPLEAALGQFTANNTIISWCLLKTDFNDAAPGGPWRGRGVAVEQSRQLANKRTLDLICAHFGVLMVRGVEHWTCIIVSANFVAMVMVCNLPPLVAQP